LVGKPGPYEPQAAFLSHFRRLHATRIQESIWQWLQTHTYVPFGSISAMPSMHVAVTTLVALGCWERSRWLGVMAWCYVAAIMVGSVQLNWHYAMDGYVALLGTLLTWWLSGTLVQRFA
jgi:membrane-associated phospholipid phosphatase